MNAPRSVRRHFGLLGPLLVTGLLVWGAMPLRAATPVSYDDPSGDQLDPRPSMDILKVSWSVEQGSADVGPWIVAEMTLAARPEAQLVNYTAAGAGSAGCHVKASYRPGTVFTAMGTTPTAQFTVGCAESIARVDARAEVKDGVITMSIPLQSIPKSIREKGELTELTATSEIAEPLSGIIGTAWWANGAADTATTDKTFRFA